MSPGEPQRGTMRVLLYLLAAVFFAAAILNAQFAIEAPFPTLIALVVACALGFWLLGLGLAYAGNPARVKRAFFTLVGVSGLVGGVLMGGMGGWIPAVVAAFGGALALAYSSRHEPAERPAAGEAPAADVSDSDPTAGSAWKALSDAFSRAHRRFLEELPLAARVASRFRRRPGLAVAVVLLSTFAFFSNMVVGDIARRQYGSITAPSRPEPAQGAFLQRWVERYKYSGLVWTGVVRPASAFSWPLGEPVGAMNRWIGLAVSQSLGLKKQRRFTFTPWRDATVGFVAGVPAAAVGTLFLVGLLGWVRDEDKRMRPGDLLRYWKAHYVPALIVTLILAVFMVALMPVIWFCNVLTDLLERLGDIALNLASAVQQAPLVVTWVGPSLVLMLAPFIIVARTTGTCEGIVEGLRLWRRRWATLVVLFVVFRVACEVLAVWMALSPWQLNGWAVSLSEPVPAAWLFLDHVGLALLGLWVAYAFMEIAKTTPANARAEGAQ